MGLFDDFIDGVVGIGPAKQYVLRRNEALHRMRSGGVRQDVEDLISRIDSLDTILQGVEYTAQTDWAETVAETREKLGEAKDIISKSVDYYDALNEIWTFVQDVKATAKFTPGEDPLNEAKAYGKAIKSLGKVAGRIPLLNIYAPVLEAIGDVFAKTVSNIVPHLRDNTPTRDGLFRQSEGRSMFD